MQKETKKLQDTTQLNELFDDYFEKQEFVCDTPASLYDPLKYSLSLGGKRIRPLLCLHAFQLFNSNVKEAIPLATSIELIHYFTLLHDDLMDSAPIRRGKPTVHTRWNQNTAILSGDILLIISFKELLKQKYPNNETILKTFLQAAEDVHKGQQFDIDFESTSYISYEEYINMIRLKTSCPIAASLKMGALAGGANIEESEELYNIGISIGVSFQLLDDLLDCYADEAIFGKIIGGDIASGKKTSLLIKFLELSDEDIKQKFLKTFLDYGLNIEQKIARVLNFYNKFNIKEVIEKEISELQESSLLAFNRLKVPTYRKNPLKELFDLLCKRGRNLDFPSNQTEFNVQDLLLLFENIFISENKLDTNEKLLTLLTELEFIPHINKAKLNEMRIKMEKKLGRCINIFISYSHADEIYKERLDKALYALKRNNKVKVWEDRLIIAGQSWEHEIFKNIEESEVILLLLSDDYISSDFCYTREFKYVLQSHVEKTKILIPIIVRPCSWQDLEFGKIQAVPKDGVPITTWRNEDIAWQEVIQAIKKSIEYFTTK